MVNLYRTDALKIQAYQIRFGKSNITINAALFIYRKPCDAEEYKMFSVHLGTGRRLYTASAGDDDDLIIDAKTEIVTILIGGLEGVRIVASVHGPLKNNIHYMNIYMTIGYNEFIWKNCGMCGNWFSTKPKSKCYVVPGGSSTYVFLISFILFLFY
jgi:hypothetical protein